VQRLLRTKIPFIICLRAKYKSRQGKNEQGKTVILKDEMTSPIQAEDFIFEATCHFEILQDHSIRLTKCSHPSLRDCFPETGPIEIKHGELLAQWCNAPGVTPEKQPIDEIKVLKSKLWNLLLPFRGDAKDWIISQEWMETNGIIAVGEKVRDFDAPKLTRVIADLKDFTAKQTHDQQPA
jgi:hypothetical protein